jgi:hypothetical protein
MLKQQPPTAIPTINYQLSTINYQLSTINYQLSTINYQLNNNDRKNLQTHQRKDQIIYSG